MTRFMAVAAAGLALLCGPVFTTGALADNPPGLMHSTLLNGVKLHHDKGTFYLDHIQAVFLPPAQSKTIYPYNPTDGGKLWAILSDSSGAKIARFDFYAELLKAPYWLLNSYNLTDLRTNEKVANKRLNLKPGNYVLDFFLKSGRFYTFPFTVSVIASGDAFRPGDFSFLDGAWNDWAYLYYREADPGQSLHWKVWLRNKEHKDSKSVKPRVEIKRDSDGKLICTSRPNRTITLKPWWNRFDFDMIFPMKGTSGGAYFKAKDLLATDGSYTLKVSLGDQLYGTWKFQVAGGKLNYTGRTVRGEADPLTFVEGGRDAWWYAREK